jgi:hypothetical protein
MKTVVLVVVQKATLRADVKKVAHLDEQKI